MPWLLLTCKLPVRSSPPKLSIFYGTPWPHTQYAEAAAIQSFDYNPADNLHDDDFGYAVNWSRAMKIHYRGNDVRVFPHECKELSVASMRNYVFGMEGEGIPSHKLVENNEASAMMLKIAKDTDLRMIYIVAKFAESTS